MDSDEAAAGIAGGRGTATATGRKPVGVEAVIATRKGTTVTGETIPATAREPDAKVLLTPTRAAGEATVVSVLHRSPTRARHPHRRPAPRPILFSHLTPGPRQRFLPPRPKPRRRPSASPSWQHGKRTRRKRRSRKTLPRAVPESSSPRWTSELMVYLRAHLPQWHLLLRRHQPLPATRLRRRPKPPMRANLTQRQLPRNQPQERSLPATPRSLVG